MGNNEQPPASTKEASAAQGAEPPLWKLSRADQRLLYITFVGGVASIAAGALVLGGAFAMVRALKPDSYLVGFMAIITVVDILAVAMGASALRRAGWPKGLLMMWLIVCAQFSFLLLVWIGYAVGLHPSG